LKKLEEKRKQEIELLKQKQIEKQKKLEEKRKKINNLSRQERLKQKVEEYKREKEKEVY
jgi:hypothetical protein